MKKGIIVLLIAVLVAGFAFAKFEGNAKITLGADFDKKTFGFGNWATGKYTFEFSYDTLAAGKDAHETDLWAEIAAEGSVKVSTEAKIAADTDVSKVANPASAEVASSVKASFKITKANIHVGEWTFGILNAGAAVDYAKSYYVDSDKKPVNDTVNGGARYVPGFTVDYQGWRGGFGIKGSWNDEKVTVDVFAHGETKAFKFGANEEFSVQAGAYVHYFNDGRVQEADKYDINLNKKAGGAVKFGYAADKLSANAAADLMVYREDGENAFVYEAAADATYKFDDKSSVGVNAYATPGILSSDNAILYTNEADLKKVKLDAKVWGKTSFDFDGTTLAVEAEAEVKDAVIDGRTFTVSAKETLTLGKLALEFSEQYGAITVKIFDVEFFKADGFTFTAKATYTAEKFTAKAGIDSLSVAKITFLGDSATALALTASCGISSTAIIENAEIGASYKGLGFYKILADGEDLTVTKGAVEAYAKIAF